MFAFLIVHLLLDVFLDWGVLYALNNSDRFTISEKTVGLSVMIVRELEVIQLVQGFLFRDLIFCHSFVILT